MDACIVVHVSERDIKDGVPGDAKSCPLALALRRLYPEGFCDQYSAYPRGPVVGPSTVVLGSQSYFMDSYTAMWVHDFDRDRKVEPFTANLTGIEGVYCGKQ